MSRKKYSSTLFFILASNMNLQLDNMSPRTICHDFCKIVIFLFFPFAAFIPAILSSATSRYDVWYPYIASWNYLVPAVLKVSLLKFHEKESRQAETSLDQPHFIVHAETENHVMQRICKEFKAV